MNTLANLDPYERASEDELRAVQLARLKWSIQHAYDHVAHYRASFAAHEVHPSDLRTLADLSRFPFLTKHDFRAHYPFGLFAVPRDRIARIHASSGTTGKPTVVGYTVNDLNAWADLVARSIHAAGGRPGDTVHIAYGYGLFTGGLGAHYGAERLGCTVIPMSGGQTERQIQCIQDFAPDLIMATPSYFLNIVAACRDRGIEPRDLSLRAGLFGAEPWTDALRAEIESSAGIDAVDIYGLSEVMGPGVASESVRTKDGPIVWEDHFYPEIIDPVSGRPVADGQSGELVLTSLSKEALPVIRYRTRDLTRLLPGTTRTMRRMAKITGRSDDMLIVRGVNLFPTQIEELLLRVPCLEPHYQLELSRSGHLDVVAVHVERSPGEPDPGVAAGLARSIKENLGVSVSVEVHDPGYLERSAGKAVRVLDRR